MSGFPDNYSAPGPVAKASVTMAHPRAAKRALTGDAEWHTQRDIADSAGEAHEGDDCVANNLVAAYSKDYDGFDHTKFLDWFGGTFDPSDEGATHLALCATHLAAAKASNIRGDTDASGRSLKGAMFHLQEFHKTLKDALNQ